MQRPSVCIIGGGVAGLSCASRLVKKNVANVTVFEAMDRLGGRVHTMYCEEVDGDPYKLDMGANWIHGCAGNPIFKIAKESRLFEKIPCKSKPAPRKVLLTFRENGEVVDKDIVRSVSGLYYDLNDQCEEYYTASLPPGYHTDSSIEDFIKGESNKVFHEKHKTNPELLRLHQDLIHSHLKVETSITGCHSMKEVSLQQFGSYTTLGGGEPAINQGFSKIVDILVKEIPSGNIVLNSPVSSIVWKSDFSGNATSLFTSGDVHQLDQKVDEACFKTDTNKVKVRCHDGVEHLFDHVIFTGSAGYLKHEHKSLFKPSLPQSKINSIQKIGFGTVDKIHLVFKDLDFLPQHTLRMMLCWQMEDTQRSKDLPDWVQKIASIGCVNTPQDNTLLTWITGAEAEQMEALSEEEVGRGCMAALRMFLNKDDLPLPQRVIRTRWHQEPFIRGSYSFIRVGASVKDIERLAEPIYDSTTEKPLVQFAGEATDSQFYSTTHGAYFSGEREADRLVDYYHKLNTK